MIRLKLCVIKHKKCNKYKKKTLVEGEEGEVNRRYFLRGDVNTHFLAAIATLNQHVYLHTTTL